VSPVAVENLAEDLDLDRLFDLDNFLTDLREGVVTNQAKGRVCLLSTDLLSGVYKALLEEAGPAWGLLLKMCGQAWGKRLARKLSDETDVLLGKEYTELPLESFLNFIVRYFSFHGWGVLELDVTQTQSRGIVEATLRHSVFAEVISEKQEGEMVDFLICGILAALMTYVSGHELDCLQTQCSSLDSSKVSRFVISDLERIEAVEELVESGAGHQRVMEAL
jgi:predicted hydrocarbon binding protein